jgi:hypothetical protein
MRALLSKEENEAQNSRFSQEQNLQIVHEAAAEVALTPISGAAGRTKILHRLAGANEGLIVCSLDSSGDTM